MFNQFLDRLADLDLGWLAVLAFFLPFGETVALLDVLVPGEVGMIFIGAAAETPGRVFVVFVAGAAGAFCGDSVSWYIGHRWGERILSRWPRIERRARPGLERATAHFERHGGRSIFFARFVGALRAIAPLVAGSAGLSYRRFAPWNAAASVVWVGLVVLLGATLGDDIANTFDRFSAAVSIVAVLVLVVMFVRSRRRSAPRPN